MINRLKQIPSFLKGDLIVLKVDKASDKLTVDAGNKTADELKTAANTLFRTAYNLSNLSKATH
jgi:hypothetical protein